MRYHYIEDPAGNSPLDLIARAGTFPLERTLDIDEADILVSRRGQHFTAERMTRPRFNLVWTHEPFGSLEMLPVIRRHGQQIHIFNVYNRNVYTDSFFYQGGAATLEPIRDESDLNVPFANKKTVAVMTSKHDQLLMDGSDVSFGRRRTRFGTRGHERGLVDVHGMGWPEGVSRGYTRQVKDRRGDKLSILAGYNFSCCFENMSWDYYTTEKLWESLMARTLPVYSKSNTIVATFGEAMLQLDSIDDVDALLDRIQAMPFGEYRDRVNYLFNVYNTLPRRKLHLASRERAQELLVNHLKAHLG